jgi:arabinogalactan oligomer/maltooligosaccharide transport system substrate-binding protein
MNGRWTTAGAALVLGLTAGIAAAQTELVVWHGYRGEEKAAFEKVAATYSDATKGVTVKTLAVPYDAYADKITAAVPRGKGPDVFIFAQDRMGGWVESGNTIEPLDFFLDDETTGRFLESTMEAMTYQGTIWGLPLNYKCITLIYNKKLVSTPPKTSAEMVKMAKSLTDAKVGKFGLAYSYADYYYHAALQNAFGGGVFDAKGQPVVNQPANVKAMELLLTWIDGGFVPQEPSSALINALFNGGNAAMVFSGPWFLGEIDPSIDVGLAMLPTLDEAGGAPMKPWMTVEGVYIAQPSKNKDAAYDFILYLTGLEAGKVMALEGGQTPANAKVYDDPAVAKNPVLSAFRKQVEVAVPMPNVPEMTMVWSPATTAMNAAVRRAASPQAALDQAEKEVVERIANLRK